MKVCLTGGGTGGSVTPLLALQQEIKKREPAAEFLFIGGKTGPEAAMVKSAKIIYKSIDAGKLRRYFSLQNFADIIKTTQGYFQARTLLKQFDPQVILSAGSYIAVPVTIAGRELGIKSFIHQLDYKKGLANKLMAPFANRVTVGFRKSLRDFSREKTIVTGNPVRPEILQGNREEGIHKFKLDKNIPTILIIGGGTGAVELNKLVSSALPNLIKHCQIIQVTGSGKKIKDKNPRFHCFEFLHEDLKDAYAVADLVISRAGMGVLSELAVLGLPSIIIPYPKSHQVDNAKMFEDAALVFQQGGLNPQKLYAVVKELITNKDKLAWLSKNIKEVLPKRANQRIVDLIFEELK
ncbi:undecaprenyldiphospho-muramoylpentapeptide beta-N-acetylglucosaminyltransferase [Patescibacteria group bacterium]|nr:undecaprenyldiphospho-muramoylpentapeptide beta-N-acetylglucosaminyltransferase [Patescibacteria group bacterium]